MLLSVAYCSRFPFFREILFCWTILVDFDDVSMNIRIQPSYYTFRNIIYTRRGFFLPCSLSQNKDRHLLHVFLPLHTDLKFLSLTFLNALLKCDSNKLALFSSVLYILPLLASCGMVKIVWYRLNFFLLDSNNFFHVDC